MVVNYVIIVAKTIISRKKLIFFRKILDFLMNYFIF